MSPPRKSKPTPPGTSAYRHTAASRPNQPTVDTEPLMSDEQRAPLPFHIDRRQITHPVLSWDRQGRTSRMEGDPTKDNTHGFASVPLYTQEKINPLTMIEQLRKPDTGTPLNLFADFNGLPPEANTWEFYQHAGHWQNRLIHGDSSEVLQSLISRDGLAGRVQMVYFDPPYGISFQSNFMTATDRLQTKDTIGEGIPVGDPAPLRAYGDTYRNGIHSYLDGIHERLVLARELLTDTGSLFLQIGDDNVHLLGVLCDEVFGIQNRMATITYATSGGGSSTRSIPAAATYLLWYAKDKTQAKYRPLYEPLDRKGVIEHFSSYAMVELADGTTRAPKPEERANPRTLPPSARIYRRQRLASPGVSTTGRSDPYRWNGHDWPCPPGEQWRVSMEGMDRLAELGRLDAAGPGSLLGWKWYENEVVGKRINNIWHRQMSTSNKRYVVQTANPVIERCLHMTTDPGDLILDPTCGSGVTAEMAEKWGRRWITIDTSRVTIAIARRHMITRTYPWWETTNQGTDPSAGFKLETIQRVSAATLAYDKVNDPENTIHLVDRPHKTRGRNRLTGPFTVESSSPYTYLPFDTPPDDQWHGAAEGEIAQTLIEALTNSPIRDTSGQAILQVVELEPWPGAKLATHEARCQTPGRDLETTAAVMLAAPDATVTARQMIDAATEARRNRADIQQLIAIGFAFEPNVPEQVGPVRIHRVIANRDLQIPGLTPSAGTGALTLLGEPSIQLDHTPDGHLTIEIHGYDTYDPTTRTVRPSDGNDIDSWMIDTAHDGANFFPRLFYAPAAKKQNYFNPLKKALGKDLDPNALKTLTGLRSHPFPPPQPGQTIAIKIITRAGHEMITRLDPSDHSKP